MLLSLLLLLAGVSQRETNAWILTPASTGGKHRYASCRTTTAVSAGKDASESKQEEKRDELLQKALELRQQVQEMETELRKKKQPAGASSTAPPAKEEIVTDMKDSIWSFSYRFSDQPDDAEQRSFYSGKVTLSFRGDGYTDLVHLEARNQDHQILKVWGWDVERSNDDGKDYLLFSMDVQLPDDKKERFYWQARQVQEGSGAIRLEEGTVTIKQDIVEAKKTPGMWGLFSPRGILAQFRYVGDFVVRKDRL